MTLRRFPWKLPRLTDNSYRLFAADPTPGHDPKKLVLPPNKSTSALSEVPQRDIFTSVDDKEKVRQEVAQSRRSENNQDKTRETASSGTTPQANTATSSGDKPKEVIRGPWRILRLLPRESRHVIGRMLEIDPKKRAKMSEILEDIWVSNTVICRQVEPGKVIKAEDHTHTLEPPTSTNPANK